MIAYLSGKVRSYHHGSLVIIVNGVGYAVHVPERYHVPVGTEAELEIYTHSTQEHGISLFGFKTVDEKTLFSLILTCSGVGPKIALAAINTLSPATFISAITTHDVKSLSTIDGIGTKKAEAIIMYLKDKVSKIKLSHDNLSEHAHHAQQLTTVLASLGYHHQEIITILDALRPEIGTIPFDLLVRKSLNLMTKN